MKYRTIAADPPWPVKDPGRRTSSPNGDSWNGAYLDGSKPVPYARMSIWEIAALPVHGIVETDAHLYLWAVNEFLTEAYMVARAWGFRPSTLLTWCKAPMGLGFGGTFANSTEFVLFCRRGNLPASRRVDTTWFQWPRGRHSKKPEHFLDLVEQVSPVPYVELFSRRHRLGWDVWGNESANTATLEPSA